jgi:hypothetical protein
MGKGSFLFIMRIEKTRLRSEEKRKRLKAQKDRVF